MTQPAPGSHSANQQADEDAGRDLYDELTDALLYDPAIGRSTMMGYPCVRLAERFLASYDESSGLVVKLPATRVAELVNSGTGLPFAPAGKVFREWVALPTLDRDLWRDLLAEAVTFARASVRGN